MSEVVSSVSVVLRGDNAPELAALENAIRHMDQSERMKFFRKMEELKVRVLSNPGIK